MRRADKAQVKKVRELMRDKQVREVTNLFVAEGMKIVGDIIRKGYTIDSIMVSRDFAGRMENRAFLQDLLVKPFPVFEVRDAEFEKISSLQHSQGVLAVLEKPSPGAVSPGGRDTLLVLCDGIQDPGNLGAIIRTSVAFDVDSVLLLGETVDIYNPKVVRASSGMVLDIPICTCDITELDCLKEAGYRLLVSQPPEGGSRNIAGIKRLSGPLIIAFGSEGRGVSRPVADRADILFSIPISTGVESLNVTAAVAISLYVFRESRR